MSIVEPIRSWYEEDGVIHFSVESDGTEGETWISRLESKGSNIGVDVKRVLRSPDFRPTSGVTTEVAILKGVLFDDQNRVTREIFAEADRRKLSRPNAELICLICERLTDKEIEAMGLWWIVAMHEPISVSGGSPDFIRVFRSMYGCWMSTYGDRRIGDRWSRNHGFMFAKSSVCAGR